MRVLVAGGGIAALEALAGLHALAGARVAPTLIAPVPTFSYRPLSTAMPFTFRRQRTRSVAELAAGLGASFVRDGLVHVDESRKRILTRNGDFLDYDALIVAVGAHTRRRPQTPPGFGELLRSVEAGVVGTAAFVVPGRAAWPVDAYELALVASLAARARPRARIRLVTAETAPLQAFGPAVSDAVSSELEQAGIELHAGVKAHEPKTIDCDQVVSLLEADGPAVGGVPHDSRGFIPVDANARVVGLADCFAAGDATTLSLKHSALSAGQAAAAAETIAAEAGADVPATPWPPLLHGILTIPPHFPGSTGSPWLPDGEPVTHCLWWPPGHVAGRFLAPYLAASDPDVRPGLGWHPQGLPVALEVNPSTGDATTPPPAPRSQNAIRRDALLRQLMAIRRIGREGAELGLGLERQGKEFERHEQETIRQLEAAGYLSH
jgi:sulfide:quinone oxidoreductase